MYSSTGDGKTMIKIGGNGGKSREEPLYSIPIQTTATLNIQLLMQKGNSSSSSSSAATDNRPGWQQQQQHQQQQLSHGPVTLVRAPASSAISSTRVNIVAEVPGSRRGPSSYFPGDDASSSLGTQTDFGTRGGDTASSIGIVTSATHSNPSGSGGGGGGGANVAVGGDGSLLSSSSTTQTGSLIDSSSQYGFLPARTLTHQTSFSDSASQCSFPDPISPSRLADLTSQSGSSTLTTVSSSSSSSSLRGDAADDDVGSEYRVFTDADGDGFGTGAGGGGGGGGGGDGGGGERGGSDEGVLKLTQGIQESLGMNGGSGGGGGGGGGDGGATDWKTAEDEEDDDSDSESWEELGKPAFPSTFNVIEWNLPNEKSPKSMACSRVIIMKDKDMILMMRTTCSTPKAGNDPRMLSLIVDIADNCSKRLRKMKTLPNLCAQHMDTLPLSDGRTTKDHLSEMSRILGENVGIREVAYRFQPTGDNYIGTFVQGTVLAKRNYAIGKLGVVAILFKKSKYATVEAFSEQLCEHIAIAQPTTLGHLSDLDLKRLNRRGTTRIKHLQKDQLFVQNFTFDPTIIVAEAARRSFVRIDDFLLFK